MEPVIFGLTLFGLGLTALTIVALGLLVWFGQWEERTIAGAAAVATLAAPSAAMLQIGTLRPGVALLEAALLTTFLICVYRGDRWWTQALAGFQIISLISHLVPLIAPRIENWSTVSTRLEIWVLINLTFFAGAWEAWAARRFAQEGGNNDQTLQRSRRPMG